jgi:pimeloyl-ACP methyl ester carboxylesterase
VTGSACFKHEFVELNGVRHHYTWAGSGPLMMFIHGLPQCWYMYRHQLTEFSADHLVVAPDIRGFNLSGKPGRLVEYGVLPSVEDVRALAAHLGYDRLVVVGHDIGVAIGWSFTLHYPAMVDGLITVGGAHPALFYRQLRDDPEQQKASRHWLSLRRPGSEAFYRAGNFAQFSTIFDEMGFFTEQDRAAYRQSWSEPGAVEGILAWARREGWGPPKGSTPAKGLYVPEVSPLSTQVPVLAIYGDADRYIRPGCYRGLEEYAPDLTVRPIVGASHWVFEEVPGVVNRHIREFLDQHVTGPEAAVIEKAST